MSVFSVSDKGCLCSVGGNKQTYVYVVMKRRTRTTRVKILMWPSGQAVSWRSYMETI